MDFLIRNVFAGFLDIWSAMMQGVLTVVTGIFDDQFGYNTQEFANMVDPNGAVLPVILDVFTWTGLGLAVLFFVFGLFKSVFGEQLSAQRENPLILLGKFFMAIFVVYFIFEFVNTTVMSIFVIPHSIIDGITPPSMALGSLGQLLTTNFSESVSSIATMEDFGRMAVGIVVFAVCTLIFIIKFLRLFVEMIERYLLMNLLIYSAPLAASTIASPSLSSVFAAWCKMLGGQMILILYNVFSIKLILTAFSAITHSSFDVSSDAGVTASLMGFMIIFGLLNVAQRFDTYLNQLSINAGITGNMFGSDGALAMRMFDKTKSAGNGFGKSSSSTMGKDSKGAKIGNANIGSNGKSGKGSGILAGFDGFTPKDSTGGVKDNAQSKGGSKTSDVKGKGTGEKRPLSNDDIRKREVANAGKLLNKDGNATNNPEKAQDNKQGSKINQANVVMQNGAEKSKGIDNAQADSKGSGILSGQVSGENANGVNAQNTINENSASSISGHNESQEGRSDTMVSNGAAISNSNGFNSVKSGGDSIGVNNNSQFANSSQSSRSDNSTNTLNSEKGNDILGNGNTGSAAASINDYAATNSNLQEPTVSSGFGNISSNDNLHEPTISSGYSGKPNDSNPYEPTISSGYSGKSNDSNPHEPTISSGTKNKTSDINPLGSAEKPVLGANKPSSGHGVARRMLENKQKSEGR